MNDKIFKNLALALSVFSMMHMVGCSKTESTFKSDEAVRISVANFVEEKEYPKTFQNQMQQIEEFETLNPNIKIDNAMWDFTIDSFLAKAEGGTLPTLYYVPFTEARRILQLGIAADLTKEFEKRGLKEGVSQFVLQKISQDNRIYLLPASCYDVGLVVNVDLYKQAGFVNEDGDLYQPKNWDDLARVAKEIQDKTGVSGFCIPDNGEDAGWRFTPIAWSCGTVFETKAEDGKWKATFDSKECETAMQFVSDLKWKYDCLPQRSGISNKDSKEIFSTGKAAMCFGEPQYVLKLVEDYGMSKDKIGMLSIPSGDKRHVTMVGGGFFVINKEASPQQIKAAMDWIEYKGYTWNLNENTKQIIEKEYNFKKDSGFIIGVESIPKWKSESRYGQYIKEKEQKMLNVDIKNIEKFNDKRGLEFQQEEPIDAQRLYKLLGDVVQNVLSNPDADIKMLLKNTAEGFQKNNLDYAQ